MQNKIINKLKKYSNIAILGFGREGKSTYNFIRRYDKDMKLTILDEKEMFKFLTSKMYSPFSNFSTII